MTLPPQTTELLTPESQGELRVDSEAETELNIQKETSRTLNPRVAGRDIVRANTGEGRRKVEGRRKTEPSLVLSCPVYIPRSNR